MSEARKDIETIQKEVIESNPNFMPTRQIDDFDNEATYKMEVEFDKLGMQEFQRKIESGEIQLDKPTQKTLENAYSQYNHLLQKRELLEKDLQGFKAFDDNNILKTNSTLIAQTQRVLNQIQDDISFTKEAIKDIENELSTSNKALMPLNTRTETKKEIHAFSNLLVPTQTQTKPSFATNLMKQDTQGLIPYNSTQANNALIPYNTPQDTKLLAYNETKLLEYKETLHALQKLDKSFKDFMSMPFSIIVDSKGNALPLTSQAIKNFIFHNLYKEFMSATKALNKPLAQLDFKPLSNEIKALPYKANANLKAHLRDINAKTNELLDSMQEFKNATKEIKLLPYNKPSENKAVEADRFRNVLGEMQSKNNIVSINADDALQRLYSIQGAKIPQELDIKSFMNTLDSIVNKDNFIAHLQKKNDSQNRLAYLNLVEPTLNKWDLKLTSGDRTDLIKVFNDGKNFFTLLITAENNKRLITFLPKAREDYIANKIKNADHIQTFISRASNENEWTRNANPTTKQEISKEIESKDIQKTEKETTRASGEKSSNESLTQAKEYTNLIDDFLYQYDLKDDLWFLKYAKLQNAHNRDEVGAALKHFNEVRDNVSIKYDDYVAATEQVKNSLNRAALDIIDDFKATDEAFEAIEKIQTKLLDDYPQTNKNISINTRLEKDSMQIESKSTQESIKDNYIQEVETIAKDFNLTDKEAIQGLINLKDEIGKNVNLLDSVHDRQNSKRLFDNLFKDYWLDFFLANQKAYKSIKDPIALKEKISDIIFPAIQKDNGITPHTKDTHANTKQHTNTTNHTDKETSTKESYTDNQHEATQRENGADTEWITTRTSNNPQENKDTRSLAERDNGISNEYSPSSKEMAQSGNEKTHEKRDIRDDSSHSSSDIEANANISRDTQGHNARIRLDETDNKRYKHDGNDDRTNSRTRIHRNVSLKKKGKKDSNTNTESKVATQDIDTQSTPQVKPKKLTDKEIIDNFLKEYDNHEYGSKEISLIKNIDKPENLMYIVKAIKDFNEAKTLQDDILKIDSKAIADAGVLSLEERQQLGRGVGDLLPTLKEAFHYLHKAPYPAEIYKISNIKKRLKEVKKAYNLVQEKGLHRFDYPQTNKDVSATLQHDKETLKTTKEIIKKAKASGKSVRETQELIDKNKATETFTDSYGKTHEIPKDIADNWKNTFNLKSLDEAYIPSFTPEVKQALDSVLQGKDIELRFGSLIKLINTGRLDIMPKIKEVLETPNKILDDGEGILFIKEFVDSDKNRYFMSVAKNYDGEWVFSSHVRRELPNIENKIKQSKVLYDKGFKGEEVAGVSDILESGGTTTKPSDLQIEYPANHSSGINPKPNPTTKVEKSQKPKPKQSPKELENIESDSNPAGILNPEELATLNKEFKLGEIQDLKGQKALYDANIESLSLLDDILKSGRVATDDEKRILSNFRGFGKASNELYQVIKEKGERLDSLNKLLESLSESVGAKIDADYLFRRAGDAYYTPTPIVESMVKLAKDLGLNNNHVILEPSSGSGRFLGQFHSNANVVGIELDPFTAKLSQTIYPYFKIDNAGFQNSKFAKDDFYDLVIGNPPYSNFTIRDEAFSASAHNYFMKRGIDKLRVGGISIQIVTKSFMDSSNDLVRKEIAKNAKFLGGVRLPNNAFKDASVTTDILVFKKVSAAEAKKLDNSWVETTELNGIPVSKYFVDNPQNVLGEMKVGKGQFGDIVHVINKEGIDFSNFDLMPYLNKKYDFLILIKSYRF